MGSITGCGDVSDDPAAQTPEQEVVSTEWVKSAPDFKLLSTQLEQVSLSSFKGKVVLLDFWATWCQPCQVEMPIFEQLHHQYESKDKKKKNTKENKKPKQKKKNKQREKP